MNKRAILLNDTSKEFHFGCEMVIQNIKTLCRKYGIDLIGSFDRNSISDTNVELMSKVGACDFIIVNGEGTCHHCAGNALKLLCFGEKPKILINAVWEKMYFATGILDKFWYISVRESRSYNEIRKCIPEERVCIVPDLSFYSTGSIRMHDIGFSDSVMDIRKRFMEENNYFPMQVEATHPDLYAYVNWLKSLDLYITGRFHGVCLAMMLKVPFLAIPSNSHKIEGLLEDCGCSDLIITSKEEIVQKRARAKELVLQAYQYAESAKEKIEKSFETISHLATTLGTNLHHPSTYRRM
jgi:polysaccharide pyruvyl transferase WcaK-like protein